jgi:hypothetical protein
MDTLRNITAFPSSGLCHIALFYSLYQPLVLDIP